MPSRNNWKDDKKATAELYDKVIQFVVGLLSESKGRKYYEKDIAERIGIDKGKLARLKKFDASNRGSTSNHKQRKEIIDNLLRVYDLKIGRNSNVSLLPLEEKKALQTLAGSLSLNLIDVSTPFEETTVPHEEILTKGGKTIKAREENTQKERFVLIAGAGASHAATKGYLPLGDEGALRIREELEKIIPKTLINEELKRLKYSYRLSPNDFETQLLAFSRFSRKKVIKILRDICGFAYIPSLIYEIIAHLLKHRFIDVVINFNYDEVLDIAVREEMQKGAYKFIFSEADCPTDYENLLINDRLKQPIYLKPHGTISHSSSLRFTREDVFSIPPELRKTIRDLLDAKIGEFSQQQEYLNLNLIIIGYNLKSFEFIELLEEYLENDKHSSVKLWVFDYEISEDFRKELSAEKNERIDIVFFDLNNYSLNDYLRTLWELIDDNFKEEYKPRGIERHLLVNHIFNFDKNQLEEITGGNKKKDRQNEYFLARFYVELVIALLQSDGLLNSKQILEDRAGDYFHLYIKGKNAKRSLRKHCEKIGLKVYKGFVWDTFIMDEPNLFYQKEKLYQFLIEKLKDCLPRRYRVNLIGEDNKTFFFNTARKIRLRNIAKITPNFIFPNNHLFSSIEPENILNTTIGWIYRFNGAVSQTENWDLMLSISEKGRFLNSCKSKGLLNDKKVELVLASYDTKEFENLRKGQEFDEEILLSKKPYFLPWWLHNRHMVLLLKKNVKNVKKANHWKERWKMVEGFFYESRMLSRRVNPVHIKGNQDDLTILLYTFVNYLYRAKKYTEQPEDGERNIPIISKNEEMEKHIEELLSLYDENIIE